MGYKEKFAKTGEAKLNNKKDRLNPGEYEVEIKRCHIFKARNKDEFFIVTFKVVSASKTGEVNAKGETWEPTPVDIEREWMVQLEQDMTDTNLKGFILASEGVDSEDEEAVNEMKDVISDLLVECLDDPADDECKNALKGKRMHVHVKIIQTKEKKKDFSLHTWSPSISKKAA